MLDQKKSIILRYEEMKAWSTKLELVPSCSVIKLPLIQKTIGDSF